MKVQTRREFLARSRTLAAGAMAATAIHPVAAWADPTSLPLGIQLYTVRNVIQADTPGTLRELYSIGYREVETAGFGKYPAKEFGQLIRDAGLSCPSAHLPMNNMDLGSVFQDAHSLGVTYATSSYLPVEGAVEITASANTVKAAPTASVAPQPRTPASLDDFKRLAAKINNLGTKTKAAGLQYAYHNHKHEFQKMPDGRFGYDVLIAETDPDLVKFEIDCGWMVLGGASPADYMKKDPSRFRMLHIKDFKSMPQGGEKPIGSELGAGFIDYRPIFETAKSIGIQHAFAEQEGPYTKPEMESARINYAYLHSMS